ncbi:MAG: hypothetical protein HQ551_04625 [Desulfobacteraceae bacterium]|nr:hypothetical protein [Desulfobacteraceae bacterium]
MKLLHRHNEQIEDIQKLTAELEKSPAFQKMREEQAVETLAKREEAAGKVKVLEKERDEIIPKLQKVLAEKEARFSQAKAAMDSAMDVAKKAKIALLGKTQTLESTIGRQREILIETSDFALDKAITFFNEKLNYLRSPGRISSKKMGALRNVFTMSKSTREQSNLRAVNAALTFCKAAISALKEMKLEPILDVAKIEKMKKKIPDIDIYTEFAGEKPLEKVNTDPFSVLP